MCACGKPNVNGTFGYRWQPNDAPSTRQVDPPTLDENDVLLYDEPGRCGGIDSHCHHYRVVRWHSSLFLLVRHGGGDERIRLPLYQTAVLDALDSTARYWMLNAIYHAHYDGARRARETVTADWTKAAAEKRIKTRKTRGTVKVWIEPAPREV